MSIRLDDTNWLAPAVGEHGLGNEWCDNFEHRVRGFNSRIRMEHGEGKHGWLALARDDVMLELVLKGAQSRMGSFTDLVVLGIGGSSLGLQMLEQALGRPDKLRLFVIDNTDPSLIAGTLADVDWANALVVPISKSGGTLETVMALGIVVSHLRAKGLDLSRHMLTITDPENGLLLKWARGHDIETLDVPPGVGGRFSVLSSVGLLPASLLGMDASSLLAGARKIEALLSTEADAALNWPARIALATTDLCRERAKRNLVFMPYASRLKGLAAWFTQLWDESLGKSQRSDGTAIEAGQAVIPAIGATDQHAQVQLFLDGPNDKVTLFIEVDAFAPDVGIPSEFEWDAFDAGFLKGKKASDVLHAQREGTSQALADRDRPNATLHIPRIDSETLGELIAGFELATAYAGIVWGIDAYDQPAVELGKRISREILGG